MIVAGVSCSNILLYCPMFSIVSSADCSVCCKQVGFCMTAAACSADLSERTMIYLSSDLSRELSFNEHCAQTTKGNNECRSFINNQLLTTKCNLRQTWVGVKVLFKAGVCSAENCMIRGVMKD